MIYGGHDVFDLQVPPNEVFEQIPSAIKPHYHWFNIPASTEVGNGDNPLTMILSETEPQDFVVLKIDIDMYVLEEALINQIIASPELISRYAPRLLMFSRETQIM